MRINHVDRLVRVFCSLDLACHSARVIILARLPTLNPVNSLTARWVESQLFEATLKVSFQIMVRSLLGKLRFP
jgi:hypothetical protein